MIDRSAPVSLNQEARLLVEEHAAGARVALPPFHILTAFELCGDVDVRLLTDAVSRIVRRHAVLRASFHNSTTLPPNQRRARVLAFTTAGTFQPGLYHQMVHDDATVDIRCLPPVDGQGQWEQQLQSVLPLEFSRPFRYDEPPLFRALLMPSRDGRSLLVLIVHHLVFDRWSSHVFQRELEMIYRSLANNQLLRLPEIRMPFPDFARWQHEQLDGVRWQEDAAFWRRQWTRFETAQIKSWELPFAVRTGVPMTAETGGARAPLAPSVAERIGTLGRTLGVTAYMVWLAALAVLLSKYTGRRRVVVWSNFANRTRADTSATIGWFVNSHMLGVDLADYMTVTELLLGVRRVVSDAARHQEIPSMLVWRNHGRPVLSDAIVVLDAVPRQRRATGADPREGLTVAAAALPKIPGGIGRPRGLYILLDESDTCMALNLTHPLHAISPGISRRFLDELEDVATRMVGNADAPLLMI